MVNRRIGIDKSIGAIRGVFSLLFTGAFVKKHRFFIAGHPGPAKDVGCQTNSDSTHHRLFDIQTGGSDVKNLLIACCLMTFQDIFIGLAQKDSGWLLDHPYSASSQHQ